MSQHATELARGARFAFGRNWERFLADLTGERIALAEASLREMLGTKSLAGKGFLDIGCGSGLFSLAARRMGARVHSFDYDPRSVACALRLRDQHFPGNGAWVIDEGSALDEAYLRRLGTFDVVYAWGVLHHTGDLWRALDLASRSVAPGGRMYLALYNDQGARSRRWLRVKQLYCSGVLGRAVVCSVFIPYFVAAGILVDLRDRRSPFRRYRSAGVRGMSVVRDWFDWLGGLPFEVAAPERVLAFCADRGLVCERQRRTDGLGNNEFVLRRRAAGGA